MSIRRTFPLLGLACALALSSPAQAQTAGALQTASSKNPFMALLEGKTTISFQFNGAVRNNTYSIGDIAGIVEIADDFKPSDAFLIGGKAPPGQGFVGRSYDEAGMLLAFPLSFGMVGVSAGARVYAEGSVPESVVDILREGSSGDLDVSLNGLGGRGITYGQVGLLTLIDMVEDSLYETYIRVGIGAHYLYSLAGGEAGFDGPAFDDNPTSRLIFNNDAVDADLNFTYPLGAGSVGGQGFAGDLFVGANVGKLYLGGLLRGGKLQHKTGDRARADWKFLADGIEELLDIVDTLSTDTIPGMTSTTTLPTTLRLEASYQLNSRLGVGAVWQDGFGGAFEMGSSFMSQASMT